MQTESSFGVTIRQKIPFVTSFLFYLLSGLGLTLFIIYLFFLPAKDSSLEMQTAYFVLAIPEFVKTALIVSLIGFISILPLYARARFYRKAILSFHENNIHIYGNKVNYDLPTNSIQLIYCMDSKDLNGQPAEKLTLYFELRDAKTIRVRLVHYLQAEEFMEKLMQYNNINFINYDFEVSPYSYKEE